MSANHSAATIALSDETGLWQAQVNPLGAALISLTRDGHAVVTPAKTSAFNSYSGVTLAPWPNRLAAGTWSYEGQTLQAKINEPARNNALHGLVHDRVFTVVRQGPASVEFSIRLGTDPVYPFDVEVLVNYELTPYGLTVKLGAVNHTSDKTVPFGAASHPYFVTELNSQLSLPAETVITADANLIPVGTAPAGTVGLERDQQVPVSELALDHCFTDLVLTVGDVAVTTLSRPDLGGNIAIWQSKEFTHLMVFTLFAHLTGQDVGPVAIEPQTCNANALQTGEGMVWLKPGQVWEASWGVEFEEELR